MKNANTRQHDDSLLTVLGMTATGRPMSWQPSKVGRLRAGRPFVTCGLAVFVASASFANLVSNGSFENGTFRYGQNPSNDFSSAQVFAGSSDIAGWTITAAAGNDVHWAENGNGFGWITPFGSRMIDLSGWSDVNNGAVMSQDFGAVGGQQYQVDFEIGVDSGLTQGGSVSIAAGIGGSTQSTTLNLPIGWSGVYWEHRTCLLYTSRCV